MDSLLQRIRHPAFKRPFRRDANLGADMMHHFAGARRALLTSAVLTLGLFGAFQPHTANADTVISTKGEQRLNAWITGYTFWDNTPPGSAAIARPVIHDEAGGVGTYEDPITIAVGRGHSGWHYAPGTRIYLENLDKYAVVEDLCGACGKGRNGRPHLDLYIGGENTSARAANACAMKITAVQSVIINPAPGYPVNPGEVAENCNTM